MTYQYTKVADFSINHIQFLDAFGKPTQELPEFARDANNLIPLLRMMELTRTFDAKAIALQRTGKLGTYPSPLGQEAIGAGVASAMREDDVMCPYYREQSAQLWRGVKMEEILLYWGGDERGSNFANAREDFPFCVPITSQVLHAAGVALAFKLRKQNRVAVTFLGDGATSKGDFYEAMNFAGVWNLPLVFVVNNNKWAISVPLEKQTATKTIAQKAIAGGIECEQVDGNDIIAVKYAAEKAMEHARSGKGAYVIEALTYRMSDHTTADDASRYRSKEEVEKHQKEDPIARIKAYLYDMNMWNDSKQQQMEAEIKAELEKSVETYLNYPAPKPESMFEYLYETLPAVYQEQKEQVKRGVK